MAKRRRKKKPAPPRPPRIWGYTRAVTAAAEAKETRARKRKLILDYANRLVERGEGFLFDLPRSIRTDRVWTFDQPFHTRPGLNEVNMCMGNGDILIVPSDLELEITVERIASVVRWLTTRDRRLVLLDCDRHLVDTGTELGRTYLAALCRASDLIRIRSKLESQYARDRMRGRREWAAPEVPWGRKVVSKRKVRRIEWDPAQLDLLIEVMARQNSGESLTQIGRDFGKRKLVRKNGIGKPTKWRNILRDWRTPRLIAQMKRMIQQTGWLGCYKIKPELAAQHPMPDPFDWTRPESEEIDS